MKKMNNKGFSLVELIIVIAIMAILIVVLAPQYLKYVEKSRNSTDLQSVTEFKDACEIWAADPDAGEGTTTPFVKGDEFEVTCDSTVNKGVAGAPTGAGANAVLSALDEAGLSINNLKCTSKTNWTKFSIHGKVENNGSITWTYPNTDSTFTDAIGYTAPAAPPAGP